MRWERVRRQNQQVGHGDSSSGPGKRWGHTCNAVKGGRFVYVFGGFGRDDCLTNQVHVFDAGTQIWTKPVIRGVPPSPRDSHSCTTVGDHLFVFGGTDGKNHLNDLHVLDTSSHTWKCVDARGEGPEAREAHSATLVGKRIFIFGGCGKASGSDDEVFYNDLYILNTACLILLVVSRKRPAVTDLDCDHGAKSQRTLSEDAAGSSQQAGPVDPSDDANKKVADSNDIDKPMIDTADANVNIVRPQEAETADVTSDVKDQDPSQLNMDAVNAETSPVNLDQANAEPLRNETTTDVGAATEAGPGGDSSPQNQGDS
ncbi:hypothetical protein Bca4012_101882 [Brassica carinata]